MKKEQIARDFDDGSHHWFALTKSKSVIKHTKRKGNKSLTNDLCQQHCHPTVDQTPSAGRGGMRIKRENGKATKSETARKDSGDAPKNREAGLFT